MIATILKGVVRFRFILLSLIDNTIVNIIIHIKKFILIYFYIYFNFRIIYIFVKLKTIIMNEKLKSIPVYLPDEKRSALKAISKSKRLAQTRLIEQELDKLFKREGYKF